MKFFTQLKKYYWYSRGGGGKSGRMSFFRGVMVRVDKKWKWGRGGQKSPKMSGRPFYTVPNMKSIFNVTPVFILRQIPERRLFCNGRVRTISAYIAFEVG